MSWHTSGHGEAFRARPHPRPPGLGTPPPTSLIILSLGIKNVGVVEMAVCGAELQQDCLVPAGAAMLLAACCLLPVACRLLVLQVRSVLFPVSL